MTNDLFISTDWGTSSLRLKLVDRNTGHTRASYSTALGIKSTFNRWQDQDDGIDRIAFYLKTLHEELKGLRKMVSFSLDGIPLVISGMASSSIGIRELTYASVPFDLKGKDLVVEKFPADKDFKHDIHLVSGVSTEGDVMRGEEVQIMGWFADHGDSAAAQLIFPGTHSKHIFIKNGLISEFKTYMTGELFDIIKSNSILKGDLINADIHSHIDTFSKAVMDVQSTELTHLLFTIRARCLQGTLSREEASAYLSGLLIGSEFVQKGNAKIVLCADGKFADLYLLALHGMPWVEEVSQVPAKDIEQLVVKGQTEILKNMEN